MLTIFSIPKAFIGIFGIIQRNAIISWTLLEPKPEIILFGNDDGVAEISKELGLTHIPDVQTNEFDTPMLDDAFARTHTLSSNPLHCYVNADIILMGGFMEAAQQAMHWSSDFLMVGRRWDVDIPDYLDFHSGWQKELAQQVQTNGRLHEAYGIDYFLFTRNLLPKNTFPSFAVGRVGWDNWFLYWVRQQKKHLLDATTFIQAIHQNHDYSHFKGGRTASRIGDEAIKNKTLAGEASIHYDVDCATHKISQHGIQTNWNGRLYLPVLKNRLEAFWYQSIYNPLIADTKPLRSRFGLTRNKI